MPLPMLPSDPMRKRPLQVIAIAAGKGGVGKSTVTVNLARALQAQGYLVGILDADIYGPSLRRMLPEDRLPAQQGPSLVPADSAGIRLITMAYFRKDNEAAAVRAPIANSLIQQFLAQVDWGQLDYLLIDFPPGTGDIQLTLCQKAQLTGAIMVTTPQEVAVMDVRKAMHLFSQVKVPILGVVENMSYYLDSSGQTHYLFGQGGGERLAAEAGVRFLGQIPIAPSISKSGDEGVPLIKMTEIDAQVAAKAFQAVAKNMISQTDPSATPQHDPLGVTQLELVNQSKHLRIHWTDGKISEAPLSILQQNCPCAACVDEISGKRRENSTAVDSAVTARSVHPVGRYALTVDFSSGCSTGIYSYSLILRLASVLQTEKTS